MEINISKTKLGLRVLLTEKNTAKVKAKMKSIRTSNCSVNPSKLVNVILDIFFDKYFEKHEPFIQKLLFDRKKYMRDLLRRDLTDDELQKELKTLTKTTAIREPILEDFSKEPIPRTVANDSDE